MTRTAVIRSGGGGTAWDTLTLDPALNLTYVGTGNGSLWSHLKRSPAGGDNLCLAWDPVAQREVWKQQQIGPWNGGTLTTAGGIHGQADAGRCTKNKGVHSGNRRRHSVEESSDAVELSFDERPASAGFVFTATQTSIRANRVVTLTSPAPASALSDIQTRLAPTNC